MNPPRTIMASNDNSSNMDSGFGFNDINSSDRVLKIETFEGDNGICSNVKIIHINSVILGAKSPFFVKLFSNGMKESEEHHVTLKIDQSEEVALMDVLNFMYKDTLSSSTTSSLIDVLMLADKFQVSSCIRHCIKLLCEIPMTCESASLFLHLPSSVIMADEVQPLTDAAKKYLVNCYKDFTKCEEEMMKLPLTIIEAILSSDDLQVTREDDVYEFVLKWARKHYPVIEERRDILTTRLASLIRFKNMRCSKLKEITTCNDFDPAYASKVVLEALIFKAESTHLHTFHASRRYTYRPVKVLEYMYPNHHSIVYLDLRKEECDNLLPSEVIFSEAFCIGEKWFYMMAQHLHSDSFGLFLYMCSQQSESASCTVAYEISARSKSTKKFVRKCQFTEKFIVGGHGYGSHNLFKVSWSRFIAPKSIYFINKVLYLMVEIEILT